MDDNLGKESVVRGDVSFGPFIDAWRGGGVEWLHRMAAWESVDSFLDQRVRLRPRRRQLGDLLPAPRAPP